MSLRRGNSWYLRLGLHQSRFLIPLGRLTEALAD
jgi:hypothetical protein